ncbi:MAG: peptide deformylase [Fastidiosipilaceae bacterium]
MAIRNIVTIGDDVLRKRAREVDRVDEKIRALIEDMKETLSDSENGIGLAAPQVGMLKRIFVIDMQDGQGSTVYINPEIIDRSGAQVGREGCLSVPGEWGEVERPASITVKAMDEDGEWFVQQADGLLATCVCHENDHLNGILFIDHVKGDLLEADDIRNESER